MVRVRPTYWPRSYEQYRPRKLTENDYAAWENALDTRSAPPKERTIQSVQALIRNRNPVRWWQLQKDFKWVQKEMKKLGLNPEDARYLL